MAFTPRRKEQVLAWATLSPTKRATWFRDLAHRHILDHRQLLADNGMYGRAVEIFEHEASAIDDFIRLAIEQGRDDDSAVEASNHLMFVLNHAPAGSIPDTILWHRACGHRVRGELLRASWTGGNSGSVLALNTLATNGVLMDYFIEAGRQNLMDENELETLSALPADVVIYRGAKMKRDGLKATANALSWTLDLPTAERFAGIGYGDGEPVLMQAQIAPANILALWQTSGREPEVVVNPARLRSIKLSFTPNKMAA